MRPAQEQHALKLRLCDTMGLGEKDGLHVSNIPLILDGYIKDGFKVCHSLACQNLLQFSYFPTMPVGM